MSQQWQVCSLVVQGHPERLADITRAIQALDGGEVAACDEAQGKLVVVLEAEETRLLLDNIASVRQIPGVLAVSLVYHQQEQEAEEAQ